MAERYDDWDIKMMSPARRRHIEVAGNIFRIFSSYLRGKTCKIYSDGRPIKISDEIKEKYKDRWEKDFKKPFPKKYFLPDLMIVCNPAIDKDRWVDGAPALIIEILSLGTLEIDKTIKRDIYKDIGVKEYWLVDCDDSDSITIIDFDSDKETELNEDDNPQFSSVNFPDLVIDFNEIFEE